jgi:hypothetical protein
MSIGLDTDGTWIDSGSATCDVHGCSRPAAIIADTWDRERFCIDHTRNAADIPAHYRVFRGWYRIVSCREHDLGLILTVRPL